MQKRNWILCMFALLLVISGCGAPVMEAGVFSWKKSAITDYKTLFADMSAIGIVELYQEISDDIESDKVRDFLTAAGEKEMGVYLLVGEPGWALEEDAESLIEEIDRVNVLNELVEETAHLRGIVVDVEPYLLEEWKEEPDELMQMYVDTMKKAYSYATEQGVNMILCIPYFYDKKGYSEELETLIAEACDGIAVMNYYRDAEVTNIEEEALCAAQSGKRIITIYEMKEPGSHGLTEKNTYYELGFDAVKKNFRELLKKYKKLDIKMAYHDYEAVKEVMEN